MSLCTDKAGYNHWRSAPFALLLKSRSRGFSTNIFITSLIRLKTVDAWRFGAPGLSL